MAYKTAIFGQASRVFRISRLAAAYGHPVIGHEPAAALATSKRAYSSFVARRGTNVSSGSSKVVWLTPGSIVVEDGADKGPVKRSSLDNCRCSQCVNPSTSQRNFDTFAVSSLTECSSHVLCAPVDEPAADSYVHPKIPTDVTPSQVESGANDLKVKWNHDGHESFYSWEFLSFYQNNDARTAEPLDLQLWGAEIASKPPSVTFEEVMSKDSDDSGVAKMTQLIRLYGMVFVEGTPHDSPAATESLLRRIAFIRETHYGGFYDFIPDMAMADTAYTNIRLPAHTDTTYFSDPAGLQSFHILSHTGKNAKGGSSLLVDGFKAAAALKKESPEAYTILQKVRLPWHASGNEGITISPDQRYPVLETGSEGELLRVRWNNDDRGVVPFEHGIDPVQWYEAARKWYEIINRQDIEYWRLLKPGTTLIFDNWRVMHGRSEFSGIRRVCGGYVNRDDFISRWRNTNYPRAQILDRIVG
ncbi:Trimethyllysine dioxygenase [Ceratocystis fimbriata CBS 114723]|uniref:trimethyllysine dioxygenase n=1 Tax=Ceratocystis fimbriata CBS 114723 TaxID=1035309 RepID=A0A2C5X140_9PEZI|nr:Trimethyllysine dioxygenase [Ceratocystis fimbriata CBS 114723]